jgi:serralysin
MARKLLVRLTLVFGIYFASIAASRNASAEEKLSGLHFCTQLSLPADQQATAKDVADRESPIAFARGPITRDVSPDTPAGAARIAVLWGNKWQQGSELRVGFLNGDPVVRQKVELYAHKWEQFANIKFKFGAPNPQIRILFRPGGSSSYIGTDALSPSLAGKPTMFFGWLTPTTADDEYSRVVIHEFGHALGAIHEHQHPDSGIPWNKPKVYAYYAATQNPPWTHEDVDNNIFKLYDQSWLQYGSYDKKSIMHYAIPKELTDGVFEVGWNRELSDLDKSVIGMIYPKAH